MIKYAKKIVKIVKQRYIYYGYYIKMSSGLRSKPLCSWEKYISYNDGILYYITVHLQYF